MITKSQGKFVTYPRDQIGFNTASSLNDVDDAHEIENF